MNLNNNLIARLMLNELPGLVGALQPAGGAPQNLGEMARRQHSQNRANAMLSAASGLLTASPNRYPLGPLQRLGAGLGAALQSYNEAGQQGGILDALGMDARRATARERGCGGASGQGCAAATGADGVRADGRRGVRSQGVGALRDAAQPGAAQGAFAPTEAGGLQRNCGAPPRPSGRAARRMEALRLREGRGQTGLRGAGT